MAKINNVIGIEVRRRLMDIEDLKHLSAEAQQRSLSAEEMARLAELLSKSTKAELDQIVIEGDSSVEAAQARVDAKGEAHDTLKARLDFEQGKTAEQLTDIAVNIKAFFRDEDVDYTSAFKRAIDFLKAMGGGTLLVPNGDYLVRADQQMTIPSNVTIQGQGNSRFYTEETESYDRIFTVGIGDENTVFDNIIVDQWGDDFDVNVNNVLGYPIVATDFRNLTFKNCEFRFWSADALMVTSYESGCEPLRVKDNHFKFKRMGSRLYDCTAAYLSNGAYQEVSGNTFESVSDNVLTTMHWMLASAIEIHSPWSNVHHNTFKKVQNCVLVVPNGDNVTYAGNETPAISINNNTAHSVSRFVEMYPTRTRTLDIRNVNITDNVCNLYGRKDYTSVSFVKTFFNAGSAVPEVDSRIHIENVHVKNNIISYDFEGGYDLDNATDRFQAGVFMINGNCNTNGVYVEDNTIVNYPYMVLNTYKRSDFVSENIQFANNTIIDCGYAKNTGGGNGLFSLGNIDSLLMEKNTIKFINKKTLNLMYIGNNINKLDYKDDNETVSLIPGFDCQTIYASSRSNIVNCGKIDIDYVRQISKDLGTPKTYYSYDGKIPEKQFYENDVVLYVSNDVQDKKGAIATGTYNNKTYEKKITRKGAYDPVLVNNPKGLAIGDSVIIKVDSGNFVTYITRINGNEISFDGINPLPNWEESTIMIPRQSGELELIVINNAVSYNQTGSLEGKSIVDTDITSSEIGGVWELYVSGNPRYSGGNYRSSTIGYLAITRVFASDALRYNVEFHETTKFLGGPAGANSLDVSAYLTDGNKEVKQTIYDWYKIRIKISGYQTGYEGSGQKVLLRRVD